MKMIDFNDVKKFFTKDTCGYNDAYKRVSSTHPLNLMLGLDKNFNPSLLLITATKPIYIPDSGMIIISVGKRTDSKYSLVFSLLNTEYIDLFCHFCSDMINSSFNCNNDNDADFLCNRYLLWKKMLEKTRNALLTDNETKGLIGELYFLKEYMFNKYGIRESLLYWTGPQKTDQDFICEDMWYEVKTVSPGAITVKISSVEQLDTDNNGNLVVLFLDKTSAKDSKHLNLNYLVKEIQDLIDDEMSKARFNEIVLASGYVYNDEYDNRNYHFIKAKMYNVTKEFPCLRHNDIPNTVGGINYELILNKIEEWGVTNEFTGV